MTAQVCTCIRHTQQPALVTIPDPHCTHPTIDAGRDAIRTAYGLGRLITIAAGLALVWVGIVTGNGTIWPPLVIAAGAGLIWRVLWTATTTKEQQT